MPLSSQALIELAGAYGIATEFWDWKGRPTQVDDESVIGILAGLGVSANTEEEAWAALEEHRDRPWLRALPPFVVTEEGRGKTIEAHGESGAPANLTVRLEDGGVLACPQVENWEPDRRIGDWYVGEASFWIPDSLPTGYHRLQLRWGDATFESTLVVSPHFLGFPKAMGNKRVWGYASQLYSCRSNDSWGMGDLGDLADMAIWSSTQHFADYMLVNPVHAAEPMPPIEPSPYLPSSRRYVNPLYIRPELVAEYAFLPEDARAQIRVLKESLAKELADSDLIQRNKVWTAKMAALRIVFDAGRSTVRQLSLEDFGRREGRPLARFATWCVLVQHFGMNWRTWPEEYQRPSSPEVAQFAEDYATEIEFFEWLQWIADTQLSHAQALAIDAGMRIGIMNDLAVGVSRESAEAWSTGEVFAQGVSVGAPPDHYNQLGQDWGQSPWRPDRLEDLAYAPFRAMVAGILRHSGGVRIDHIMGLFRLWWIPEGLPPTKGSYVRYNHEAMVGILVLEAHRAGALVIGEDLGTVEPWVRSYLRDRGILGTSIAWFEANPDGSPLPPEAYREYAMASVTTHDMPPTAGYLAKTHIELQNRLGLLTESVEEEERLADEKFGQWNSLLRGRQLLADGPDAVEEQVLAMHRFLLQTPSRVLCAALTDAVGDHRMQNQPGTLDEYPNWRVPLSGPDGQPVALEELWINERAARLAAVMNGFAASELGRRK